MSLPSRNKYRTQRLPVGNQARATLWWMLCALLVGALLLSGVGRTLAEPRPIRIALTPVILDDQVGFLDRWRAYLAQELGREVQFVRRNTYGEIIELALRDSVDFAWLCGFPYVRYDDELDLLLAPLFQGEPRYQSYLIVPADDTTTRDLMDLQGTIFAFSDPNSNSGWLYPESILRSHGTTAEQHFEHSFYTWGHRRVIEAVAHGLADGGAVDGYVWETLATQEPALTAMTRRVTRSDAFGFPPLVATRAADKDSREAMRSVLKDMSDSERGRELLASLNLDGFVEVEPALYDAIRALNERLLR